MIRPAPDDIAAGALLAAVFAPAIFGLNWATFVFAVVAIAVAATAIFVSREGEVS